MFQSDNRPRFIIVAGPNGAGKSTFASTYAKNVAYINGDEIKRLYKQDQGKSPDQFTLRQIIQSRIEDYVRQGQSFAMESNLVSNYSYEIVKELSAKGYSTELIYIGVEEVDTLNNRIQQRTLLGFHYVKPEDVRNRYQEALTKLPANLKHFEKATFIDNSIQEKSGTEVLQLKSGMIIAKDPDQLPGWLAKIFPIIEKLSEAYKKLRGE